MYAHSDYQERKKNRVKDFVHVAGQLGVTHTLMFSQTESGTNLRMARLPRGPTLNFRVMSYSNMKDVLAMQKRPRLVQSDFQTAPLVIITQSICPNPILTGSKLGCSEQFFE